jgi:hypothetical protein
MKRLLSRRAFAVLLILLTSSLAGLSLAVVAFGQSGGGDPDATVPLGDYTGTTPSTTPLSSHTTTTSTAPLSSYTTPAKTTPSSTTKTTAPTETGASSPTVTNGNKPARSHGTTSVPNGSASLPSRSTGRAPTKLAFTGGEPIVLGAFGALLMVSGVALAQRRRRARSTDL